MTFEKIISIFDSLNYVRLTNMMDILKKYIPKERKIMFDDFDELTQHFHTVNLKDKHIKVLFSTREDGKQMGEFRVEKNFFLKESYKKEKKKKDKYFKNYNIGEGNKRKSVPLVTSPLAASIPSKAAGDVGCQRSRFSPSPGVRLSLCLRINLRPYLLRHPSLSSHMASQSHF